MSALSESAVNSPSVFLEPSTSINSKYGVSHFIISIVLLVPEVYFCCIFLLWIHLSLIQSTLVGIAVLDFGTSHLGTLTWNKHWYRKQHGMFVSLVLTVEWRLQCSVYDRLFTQYQNKFWKILFAHSWQFILS